MSDGISDSHDDEEFLISTRQRRSNAGNKMKKLLEQELEDIRSKTENIDDDDLNLLFQEDVDDVEFEANPELSGPENDESEERETQPKEPSNEADDMLISDSEGESSDNDEEDEGERELQKEKSLQKRKRKKTVAPILRKRSKGPSNEVNNQSKKKTTTELLTAESLLVSDRRTSKRSSVVANKLEVYEKLSRAERKRKLIQERIKKHKELQKEELLTQEDRMRIALETEKFNLQSLNKYKEQEISKKQNRLAMQQRQKIKFKSGELIAQELSTAWEVTPIMELEDRSYWEEQTKKREKKKKKYPRRQKKQSPDPITKISPEEKNKLESVSNDQKPVFDESNGAIQEKCDPTIGTSDVGNSIENLKSEEEFSAKPLISEINTNESVKNVNNEIEKEEQTNDTSPMIKRAQSTQAKHGKVEIDYIQSTEEISKDNLEVMQQDGEHSEVVDDNVGDKTIHNYFDNKQISHNSEEEKTSFEESCNGKAFENDDLIGSSMTSVDKTKKKQVTFSEIDSTRHFETDQKVSDSTSYVVDDLDESKQSTQPPDLEPDLGSEEESNTEGPSQLVAKNFVTLYRFPGEQINGDIRNELFGKQWSNSTRQRSPTVEPICKITMPDDFELTNKSFIVPDLAFLEKLPAFGEYGKKVIHDTNDDNQKQFEIEIKTQPPSGVLFPNGVRKRCLITNKECQYFDPKNGVPYSDVEAYKIIQEIQDSSIVEMENDVNPRFNWFGFRNGGIYLDTHQKPAKNVPEGF